MLKIFNFTMLRNGGLLLFLFKLFLPEKNNCSHWQKQNICQDEKVLYEIAAYQDTYFLTLTNLV